MVKVNQICSRPSGEMHSPRISSWWELTLPKSRDLEATDKGALRAARPLKM